MFRKVFLAQLPAELGENVKSPKGENFTLEGAVGASPVDLHVLSFFIIHH